MFNLIAGAFAAVGMMFGGLFGGHASTTPMHGSMGMGSSTAMHGMMMGSSTAMHGRMGSSTPMMGMMAGKGVMGLVTSVNGSTITVSGKDAMQSATTTYSVDASAAKIVKGSATSSVSSIVVGDRVMVEGTVSGTSVSAKLVIDGVGGMMKMAQGMMHKMAPGSMHMGEGSSSPDQPPVQQ
jgi:hypothetical protein